MSGLDSAAAADRRVPARRRGFWTDARFFLGIVLIAASIGGVWAVVALSRQTTPVYAASHTIVPGQELTADDLTVVDVALGHTVDSYLVPGGALDAVATRTIEAGELVPRAASAPVSAATVTTVVVRSASRCPPPCGPAPRWSCGRLHRPDATNTTRRASSSRAPPWSRSPATTR
ncbi:SAF domain-containing protein [Microbacterium elymi]|uniref:SAF domain-containing protein n=1 Tax=Microbacterium elymi TaxID=2909587 RepID=A0ABY5NKN2_9MICO|nr:SAF domain-containing protein [Microbacterium elymi]UUT35694.1 SAF domain-containing protein [Microbacterium elymi]